MQPDCDDQARRAVSMDTAQLLHLLHFNRHLTNQQVDSHLRLKIDPLISDIFSSLPHQQLIGFAAH
jgi:hypothetical protein